VVLQFGCAANPAVEASSEALKALHGKYARRGLVVLAIYDASLSPEETARQVRAQELPYAAGIVQETPQLGWNGPAFRGYGVNALPAVFVIGRDGRVRAIDLAAGELEEKVRDLLTERE